MARKSKTSGVEIPLAKVQDYLLKHSCCVLTSRANILNPEEIEDDVMKLGYALVCIQPASKSSISFFIANINKDIDFSMNILSVALRYCFDEFIFKLPGGEVPEEFKTLGARIRGISEGFKDSDEDE